MARVGVGQTGRVEQRRRSREEETAKRARTRARANAYGSRRDNNPHASHLIPTRQLELDDVELSHIGQLIAGVEDFKILRGSVAVLSLTTSTEFAHLLADASMISRGSVIVADLYEVSRAYVFGEDEDDDDLET